MKFSLNVIDSSAVLVRFLTCSYFGQFKVLKGVSKILGPKRQDIGILLPEKAIIMGNMKSEILKGRMETLNIVCRFF